MTIASSGVPARSDLRIDVFGSCVMLAAISTRSASRSALRERRGGAAARRRSSSSASVARASPTSPKVFAWLRPISAPSTSSWITCASGFGAASARRLPTTRITSAASKCRRSALCGKSAAPSERSPVSLTAPLPSADWTTPAWRYSATAASTPAPFRDRRDRVELVVDLVQHADVLPELSLRHLAREHQHGRGGGVGGAEAGGRVEEPGPRHDEGRAEGRSRAGVAVGHVRRRLLVACDDEADPGLVPERRQHPVELDAGQAEHHPHAFAVELFHERLAAGHPGHLIAPLGCRRPRRRSWPARERYHARVGLGSRKQMTASLLGP